MFWFHCSSRYSIEKSKTTYTSKKTIPRSGIWLSRMRKYGNISKNLENRSPRTPEEQKFYIMGYWDADGGCPKNPTLQKKIYIKFTQKDKKSLIDLKKMIESFGIRCGKVRLSENAQYGKIWRFSITNKEGILKFCKKIGSMHPEKKLRMKTIINLLSTRHRERAAGSPPKFYNRAI